MKTLTSLVLVMALSIGFCLGQAKVIETKKDSVNVELERNLISIEQKQLRDSINQSLEVFNAKIKQVPASKKKKLEQARKDLLLNKEILQRDIDEVAITAQNAWTDENVKRLKINASQIRREYVRIRAELKN